MKRLFTILLALAMLLPGRAVLKEKDLEQTLEILRTELVAYHNELTNQADQRKERNQAIITQLMETMKQSNQNALMLYSQNQDYVFDLTYACHVATEQYMDFQRSQLPFREFIANADSEIAKYDSLVTSLKAVRQSQLSERARVNRNVCLTLATSIGNILQENRAEIADYMGYYETTELRLKHLNDYANKRYNEIQTNIFRNGGENYISILEDLSRKWQAMKQAVQKKYRFDEKSQWSGGWILGLFAVIGFYILVAVVLNLLAFRFFIPERLKSEEFLKKRSCIIMATTTVTFAIIQGVLINSSEQNFLIMASNLLVEYAWLLGVILISLLLRVSGQQIRSAFRIYAPLIVVGFLVIAFRIILIPNELVNLVFPPVLLVCTLWQWNVIHRHNKNVPRSDMFYTYISLMVFIASVVCSWVGYTLLAVQILIWWIMQLTCILTITCIQLYVHRYGERHGLEKAPITKAWLYLLFYRVLLPVLAVLSVMVSIYWAADVFNLSDLCWKLFNKNFINFESFQISIIKLSIVVCLWFLFRYIVNSLLDLMRMHFEHQDPSSAQSRMVMVRNVLQLVVWGTWLLLSLSILNISLVWLAAITGGLSTGVGFASKDIIENLYYGASLMAGRVKVGDWIEVDGTMGKVASISYTSTVVESLYGEVITFQNSQLFTKNYKNLTRNHGYVLAVVPFGVAYGSNLKQVTQLVEEAVNGLHHQWTDRRKPVKCVMKAMGDSSVDFNLFVWSDAVKKAYVVSDVLKCVYTTLNEHGIEIPFPQRDVHIRQ